jgi:hypothetical protein
LSKEKEGKKAHVKNLKEERAENAATRLDKNKKIEV